MALNVGLSRWEMRSRSRALCPGPFRLCQVPGEDKAALREGGSRQPAPGLMPKPGQSCHQHPHTHPSPELAPASQPTCWDSSQNGPS